MDMSFLVVCFLVGPLVAYATLDDIINPFPLHEISLDRDSLYNKALSLNTEYMLQLNADQLLHTFRLNAGLPSSARAFTGSWEDPSCEVRGQFMGHYLSACVMLVNHTGMWLPLHVKC